MSSRRLDRRGFGEGCAALPHRVQNDDQFAGHGDNGHPVPVSHFQHQPPAPERAIRSRFRIRVYAALGISQDPQPTPVWPKPDARGTPGRIMAYVIFWVVVAHPRRKIAVVKLANVISDADILCALEAEIAVLLSGRTIRYGRRCSPARRHSSQSCVGPVSSRSAGGEPRGSGSGSVSGGSGS